jgi:rod shape determining protein RodA
MVKLTRFFSPKNLSNSPSDWINMQRNQGEYRSVWQLIHIDRALLFGLLVLLGLGMIVLYSAASEDMSVIVRQLTRILIAFVVLFTFAQIPPKKYHHWAPALYGIGLILLVAVLIIGDVGKGAQRWLDFGILRFQPSELMKLALPMMLARFFHARHLPPNFKEIFIALLMIGVPALLTAKQPDLGTALIIGLSGVCVLFLAGMSWRLIIAGLLTVTAIAPVAWHYMHDYQRQRVLTFLNPERDPLGTGYHIIQSKIAIGSGGVFGRGWLQGTQSHLQFLPEHATDFIFGVVGEEFGLVGSLMLLAAYLFILGRCIYISVQAQDTFTRLLSGSITMIFFISAFVNIGMVTGILPVVGLPLPLVSYGGTSMVTLIASFGILMSIQTHRRLVSA